MPKLATLYVDMLELDDAKSSARHSVVTTPVRTTPAAVLANPSRADTRNASAWVMRVITNQKAKSTGRGQADTCLLNLRHMRAAKLDDLRHTTA